MKKIFVSLLILSFFITPTPLFSAELDQNINEQAVVLSNFKLKKELKEAIEEIYGKENTQEIYDNVLLHAKTAIENRPQELLEQDETRPSEWYKNEIIYMFYVDQFGVVSDEKKNTFKDITKMLDYLEDLGVTTLYILPFADSPMKDAGFDVKNPRNVRKDLGGMVEFQSFIKQAKKRNFKIKADLVLNHISDTHEWFKKLENGDESVLNYFIYKDKMPEYKKYVDENLGTVVEYKEDDGTISKRRLIFPENTENNYRKVTVNNKDYYLYHTFYPFQLDINWENPEVLYYELDTISKWANLGVDIFRMDAIPYLSKEKGTNAENRPKTHSIVKLLSSYIQLSAPSSVIQVEACQPPKDILQYFGKDRELELTLKTKDGITKRPLKRTNQAQIAYHFPYMDALWATLITQDKKYFIETYKNTPQIPKTAAWGIFLRVHDELTLEMVSPEIRKIIFDDLISKGASFRNGFGVSGRLANFLDKNPSRIEEAFSILLSLPGVPIIYYGDELGATNDFQNAKKSAQLRKKETTSTSSLLSYFDSRDIHRGNIAQKLFYGSSLGYYKFNSKVYKKVKNLIELRRSLPVMADGDFEILKTASKSNFSYIRKNKTSTILVINNLSKDKLIAQINLPKDIIIKKKGKKITSLKNLVNNDNIKVNVSLQNSVMNLRLAPYQTLWLEL